MESKNTTSTSVIIKSIFLIISVIIVVAIGVNAYNFANSVFSDEPCSRTSMEFEVIVGENDDIDDVSSLLKAFGIIEDELVFKTKFQISGYKNELSAGTYKLSPAMVPSKIIKTLCNIKDE